MARQGWQGRVAVDIRDSEPDWAPFVQPRAPDGAPNVLMIVWDDVGYGAMDVFGGPIETPTMRRIADVTGGTYSRADNPQTMRDIYATIAELEKSRFEGETFTRFSEIAPAFLAVAALALAAEVALRSTLFRRIA